MFETNQQLFSNMFIYTENDTEFKETLKHQFLAKDTPTTFKYMITFTKLSLFSKIYIFENFKFKLINVLCWFVWHYFYFVYFVHFIYCWGPHSLTSLIMFVIVLSISGQSLSSLRLFRFLRVPRAAARSALGLRRRYVCPSCCSNSLFRRCVFSDQIL